MTIWLDPYEEEEKHREENEMHVCNSNYFQKYPKSITDKMQNNFKSSNV